MCVSLREVDETNFRQCVDLKVADEQTDFVASNVYSIAESKVRPYLVPQAICAGKELIGFALYGRDPKTGKYWIARFMIGAEFQGKGYGKAALSKLIDKLKRLPEANEIFLSFVPGNEHAEKLYRRNGFEETGESNESGEIIMRLAINANAKTESLI
ncbi:MAG: GCN5-related N-acetyltransferase [Acidobacteria bacterium]|nr:GCN5-related N-acetyltransferase [Acidobacteriota bacterium]